MQRACASQPADGLHSAAAAGSASTRAARPMGTTARTAPFVTDLPPECVPQMRGAEPEEEGFAGRRAAKPEHEADRGGLTRTIGAEQGNDFAPRNRQVDATQGVDVTVALTDRAQLDDGVHRIAPTGTRGRSPR